MFRFETKGLGLVCFPQCGPTNSFLFGLQVSSFVAFFMCFQILILGVICFVMVPTAHLFFCPRSFDLRTSYMCPLLSILLMQFPFGSSLLIFGFLQLLLEQLHSTLWNRTFSYQYLLKVMQQLCCLFLFYFISKY